jgi:hypothetical protein
MQRIKVKKIALVLGFNIIGCIYPEKVTYKKRPGY